MNLIEKILARASGRPAVTPGEVVVAEVDTIILHDLSAYLTGQVVAQEMRQGKILYPERVLIVFDHYFSPASEEGARILQANREFARRYGITQLFDSGSGICHYVAMEQGFSRPGTVIVGSDSHTPMHGVLGAFATGIGNNSIAALGFLKGKAWFRVPSTIRINLEGRLGTGVTPRDVGLYLNGMLGEDGAAYRAVEYGGPLIRSLPVEERMIFTLMGIDLGAKAAFMEPDEATVAYVRGFTDRPFEVVRNDAEPDYEAVHTVEVSSLGPQVACPPTVGNVKPVAEVEGVGISHAEVGGSTGGRLQDLRLLARMLEGRQVHPQVRLQVVPGSRRIFMQALAEGLIDTIYRAGANLFPAGAGSNQATNMGALTAGQTMICTLPRNFPGRHGSPKALVYLASTATVAASAIKGCIADPRQFLA